MSEFLDYEDIVPELYYAITINSNGIITGRHESKEPINSLQFYENPWLHGDVVKGIAADAEYVEGMNVGQYDELGRYRGDVWSIENEFMSLPDGYEIVNGELIETPILEPEVTVPAEDPPPPSENASLFLMIDEQNRRLAEMQDLINTLLSEKGSS